MSHKKAASLLEWVTLELMFWVRVLCSAIFKGGDDDEIGQKSRRDCCVGGCSWRRRREGSREGRLQIISTNENVVFSHFL